MSKSATRNDRTFTGDAHRHGTWRARRFKSSSTSRAKCRTGARPSAQTLGFMRDSVSVKQAVRRGLLVVNGPVLLLLLGPVAVFAYLVNHNVISQKYNWLALLLFAAGFVLAWLWWSLSVARWRVWAYERVEDIPALKKHAVAAGLTWPDGHVLEKTEIKTKGLAKRQHELDPPA